VRLEHLVISVESVSVSVCRRLSVSEQCLSIWCTGLSASGERMPEGISACALSTWSSVFWSVCVSVCQRVKNQYLFAVDQCRVNNLSVSGSGVWGVSLLHSTWSSSAVASSFRPMCAYRSASVPAALIPMCPLSLQRACD
jgi:hypothetical protein